MSIFDPAAFVVGLLAKFGITPAEIHATHSAIIAEINTFRIEREGFKIGSQRVVTMFIERLDNQDERLNRIETLLVNLSAVAGIPANARAFPPPLSAPSTINGKIDP